MANTVRTYWNLNGDLVKDHRDGKTGWVSSPRLDERASKRTERAAAIREAWDSLAGED